MLSIKYWFLTCFFAALIFWLFNSEFTIQISKNNQTATTEQKTSISNHQEVLNTEDQVVPQLDSQKSTNNANNSAPSTSPLGADPFKEFLEKQKQNSKDQVVSPFGKN